MLKYANASIPASSTTGASSEPSVTATRARRRASRNAPDDHARPRPHSSVSMTLGTHRRYRLASSPAYAVAASRLTTRAGNRAPGVALTLSVPSRATYDVKLRSLATKSAHRRDRPPTGQSMTVATPRVPCPAVSQIGGTAYQDRNAPRNAKISNPARPGTGRRGLRGGRRLVTRTG